MLQNDSIKQLLNEGGDIIKSQPAPGSMVAYRGRQMLVLATLPDVVLALDGIRTVKIQESVLRFITAQAPRRTNYTVAEHARALAGCDLIIVDYLDMLR